jgi:hypothetical protein
MPEGMMSFVVSAGHDEYGPGDAEGLTVEDYTVEVLRATLSGDFEGEVPDWKDAVVDDSIVTVHGYDHDVQYESFYWWHGSRGAVEAGFESLFNDVESGPQGADDDTFDYWPSGVKYLQQVADQLGPEYRRRVDTMARANILTKRAEFADELLNACGLE